MFETIGTLLSNFNIFGVGLYLVIIGLIFAVSRGISGNEKGQILLWSITLGIFATLLLFKSDVIKGFLFITTTLVIIIYGLSILGRRPKT